MNIFDLPPVNATLNGLSACLIAVGWNAILRDRKRVHIACMVTALVCSTIILGCYLAYHFGLLSSVGEGSVKFTAGRLGPTALLHHLDDPFTVSIYDPAVADYDRDSGASARASTATANSGRFTMPIWLYLSVTGVIVYFMLYQWYPSTHFDELKKRYELKMKVLSLQKWT